ncbi:MAG TPA: hypothetical protein VEB18_03155 [Candidatus Paceibacterota bacterium]|nr:hypothetical protein [Candidatus Paceibacterota bacterium]
MDNIVAIAFLAFMVAMISYVLFAMHRLKRKRKAVGLKTPFLTSDNAAIADHMNSLPPFVRLVILVLVVLFVGGVFLYAFFRP